MARYTDASCRLCRREGLKLYLKGERCYTDKCAVTRRQYAPGQHGQRRSKQSEYGLQLREKQKAKRIYGVLEKQFYKYFEIAENRKGKTGDNLIQILESRLDNAVYRMGFATSRKEARQLVLHRHFTVNGQRVNIASFMINEGDVIAVREESKKSSKFQEIAEMTASKVAPKWLEVDSENFVGKVVALPTKEDIDIPIEDHLIVELYSK